MVVLYGLLFPAEHPWSSPDDRPNARPVPAVHRLRNCGQAGHLLRCRYEPPGGVGFTRF